MPRAGPARRLAFGLSVLVASRVAAFLCFPVYDDAFITFTYARNLASGAGLVYQAGERVLGVTTPLFAIVIAPFAAAGLPLESVVPWLNVLLEAALVWRLARALSQAGYAPAGSLLPFVIAASPIMGRITIGGMEAVLFALLTVIAFEVHLAGRVVPAAILGAVGYYVRPESVAVLGVIGLDLLRHRRWRDAARVTATAVAILAAGAGLTYGIYGSWVSQSVLAKRGLASTLPGLLRDFLAADPASALLAPLGAAGAWLLVRDRRRHLAVLVCAFAAVYLAAYAVALPKVWSWYTYPVQIGLAVASAVAAAATVGRWPAASRVAGPLAAAAVVAVWCGVAWRKGPDLVTPRVYVPLRDECAALMRPKSRVAAGDIGVLGYYCDIRVLDTAGLVWPQMLQYRDEATMVREQRPDYLFLTADAPSLALAGRCYDARWRLSPTTPSRSPRLSELNAGWTADYILFAAAPRGTPGCALPAALPPTEP